MNSKYRFLASNTIIFAIGNVLVKLISFILMPLYTSVLTTTQYGVAELINNTIEIVLPLATLCIIEAVYRFLIDKDVKPSVLLVNSLVIVIVGDIFVGIVSLIGFYITGYEYSLYFLLLYVTTTFYKLTTQFARGLGHVKRYVIYGVINSLLLVGSNVILLVFLDGGIEAYLVSFSIGYGVTGIIALILSKEYKYIKIKSYDFFKLKEMLQYSLPNIPNMLSWWINSLSDRYIVLWFWGSNLAGLYTAASKLPAMVNLITSIFQQAWQYSAAIEINSEDNKYFFTNVFRLYSYFSVVICCGLIMINKVICKILLQSEFYLCWRFIPLLLLAATFGCIGTYFGTFYNAIKNNKMLMVSTMVGAIVNIVINFILIPILGAMGAAIATAISYFIVMVVRIVNVRKIIRIDISIKRLVVQFAILFVSTIVGCFEGKVFTCIKICSFIFILLTDYKILIKGIKMLNK